MDRLNLKTRNEILEGRNFGAQQFQVNSHLKFHTESLPKASFHCTKLQKSSLGSSKAKLVLSFKISLLETSKLSQSFTQQPRLKTNITTNFHPQNQ
jgi:hypothetical protein